MKTNSSIYLFAHVFFLPLQPASEEAWVALKRETEAEKKLRKKFWEAENIPTFATRYGRSERGKGKMGDGLKEGNGTQASEFRLRKKTKKKFAGSEKFPTFAVPNETGADERSLEALKTETETTGITGGTAERKDQREL